MKQMPLTKRQREVFDYLRKHINEHGYAPSIAEMNAALGIASLATGWKHLDTLRQKGYIARRMFGRRAVEIVPPPDCCPTCGRKLGEDLTKAS